MNRTQQAGFNAFKPFLGDFNECLKRQLDEHIEKIPTFFENSILNFSDDFKKFLRFNSKSFPMLVHIYRSFLEFPPSISAALVAWFESMYLSEKMEDMLTEDVMLKHTRAFENGLYKDMEIPLLKEIEENGFNLNVRRYIETESREEAVDVPAGWAELKKLKRPGNIHRG